MASRAAMGWIIRELRRKVLDVGPEDLDDDVVYPGDSIRLNAEFYNLASTLVTPTTPRVKIWNSEDTVVVTSATTTNTGTGLERYDYQLATDAFSGVWRAQFEGSVSSLISRQTKEFEVRRTQRIWTNDELEDYLDRHRVFVGGNEAREKLTFNVGKTRYASQFDTFEWVTLYSGDTTTGTVTPDSSNLVAGEFTFTSSQSIEIFLEGHSYNILLAAAECLEELAADPSRPYQWSRGGVTQRSQDPMKLAQSYRNLGSGMQSMQFIKTYGGS